MHIVKFRVVTVSSNTNSFGLYGVIMMDSDGNAWQIATSYIYKPERGDILDAWISDKTNDLLRIVQINYEIPHKLPKADISVAKEVWSNDFLMQRKQGGIV